MDKELACGQNFFESNKSWTEENSFLSKLLEALESNKTEGHFHRLTDQLGGDGADGVCAMAMLFSQGFGENSLF